MAGVPIIEAWELAAGASGSPALFRAVRSWKPEVISGQTPSEAVSQSGAFPELFANMYHTGEISGQLDTTLNRLHRLYQDEAARKMRALAEWTPKFIYFGIVIMIAWQVVSFYSNYFGMVNDALKF